MSVESISLYRFTCDSDGAQRHGCSARTQPTPGHDLTEAARLASHREGWSIEVEGDDPNDVFAMVKVHARCQHHIGDPTGREPGETSAATDLAWSQP